MTVRELFPTLFYQDSLTDPAFVAELDEACRALAAEDRAGISWSQEHGYLGYTSYASLNDLPARDPRFAELVRYLNRHVAGFAESCGFELGGKRLKLDSLWVNVLKPGGAHSGHLHPNSVVSGTLYVAVPPGSGALRLEDPRLPMLMAAPPRRSPSFVYIEPEPGSVFLWESWLRHEVMPHAGKGERISVSFNYRW